MKYLLDTCLISELVKDMERCHVPVFNPWAAH